MITTDPTYWNRDLWNDWTKLHLLSRYYAIDKFKSGSSALSDVELTEVGSVAGESLLDLQCHLGLSTLTWARNGACATGVDFSEASIVAARQLSRQLGILAEFICSDIYDLPRVLDHQFDVVYTAVGVLCWLPDLIRWAEIIAGFLKPGGRFYINEIHPLKKILTPRLQDDRGTPIHLGYFGGLEPVRVEEHGSYAAPDADMWHAAFYWSHSLGEVIPALVKAGLSIEFLHEFPSDDHSGWPVGFSILSRKRHADFGMNT